MKRFALFAATVLVPCGLLIAFGWVMIRQDRELAARHAEDQRRAAALQQRQQRFARLESMKRAAVEDFFAGRKPAVDFAVLVSDSGIHAPWEAATPQALDLEACEHTEFAGRAPREAVACYERALASAVDARGTAYTRLLLGRALMRAGDVRRATQVNLQLLAAPLALADEQGVPFAYYAADRLLHDPSEAPAVRARFQEPPPATALAAAYLLKTIAERLGDADLQSRAADGIRFAAEVEALRADLPGLLPALRRDGPEPAWIEPGAWQIGLAKAPESGKELLVAIASDRLPAQLPIPAGTPASRRTAVYAASLALVLLIAASGAYLLWRDVRRDVQLAEMRSQFVSSVSHELKTPLTAIRMFAETLRLPPAGIVAREEYLDTIVNECERLSRLVDNVLDFSKMEQGRKLYQLRPTSIGAVLDAVAHAAQYPLQQAGFALGIAAEEPLPEVNADADALQQAVLNLVMNAMKYSGARKEIELIAGREDGAVVIAVRDYGVGIALEHRQRIFERFYRVPSAENQRIPGAGLGLTLVAHIAKAHGGDVTVESTLGAGSIFALRLPLEQRA